MIDEILFMEMRLLRQFSERFHIDHLNPMRCLIITKSGITSKSVMKVLESY